MILNLFHLKFKRKILPVILLGVFFFSCQQSKTRDQDQVRVEVRAFKTETGWGYEIGNSKRTLISQPFIPGIPGRQPFNTEEEALRVGKLALKKIEGKKILPTITKEDIDSLKISYK